MVKGVALRQQEGERIWRRDMGLSFKEGSWNLPVLHKSQDSVPCPRRLWGSLCPRKLYAWLKSRTLSTWRKVRTDTGGKQQLLPWAQHSTSKLNNHKWSCSNNWQCMWLKINSLLQSCLDSPKFGLIDPNHLKLLLYDIPLRALSNHYYNEFHFSNTTGEQ